MSSSEELGKSPQPDTPSDTLVHENNQDDLWDIKISLIGDTIEKEVKTPDISDVVSSFAKNAQNLLVLFSMPYGVMYAGLSDSYRQRDFIRALTVTKTFDWENCPEKHDAVHKEMVRLWQTETKAAVDKDAVQRLRSLFATTVIGRIVQVVYSAGLSMAWTAFESLASDLHKQSIYDPCK